MKRRILYRLHQFQARCRLLVSKHCSFSLIIGFIDKKNCVVRLQDLCCSILWTTQRSGGMCSSAPASAPSGWTICAAEHGTKSSWRPRTASARVASARSSRPRRTEEVRGGCRSSLTNKVSSSKLIMNQSMYRHVQ